MVRAVSGQRKQLCLFPVLKVGSKMKTYQRWLAGFLGIVLAGFFAAGALVVWLDPFFQYHKPLEGFP